MKKIDLIQNPFILFFPFLIIYILYIIIFPTDGNYGDEQRYLSYAQNLLHGYFSNPYPNIAIENGPGYPIILMPFLAFKLPQISIALVNALFYYLSVVFLYKALHLIVRHQMALFISLFWAFYYNLYHYLPIILTETFTVFLISILIFSLLKAFIPNGTKQTKRYLVLSGITIGYIVLTKFIFSYVMLFMLAGTIILWYYNRKSSDYKKGAIILIISLSVNIPYLVYTYNLTGKVFYWGSTGGDNLYWMSTPFEGEYGDWHNFDAPSDSKNSLVLNHQKDREMISNINRLPDDDIIKKIAINNITSFPLKYLQNWTCNIGRMLFGFPFSYEPQRPGPLLILPQSAIICVLLMFSLIPTFINWKKIIYSIRFLIFFTLLYLGGSSLVSAEPRMFTIIIPVLLVWIAYILQNTMKINLKFQHNQN
jgi:hypothetical protein